MFLKVNAESREQSIKQLIDSSLDQLVVFLSHLLLAVCLFFGLLELLGFGGLQTGIFELLKEHFGVVVGAVVVFFLFASHQLLNETWSLDGFLVLLRVFLNHSVGVVSEHVDLNADLLVETNEAVVHDIAVELELASATESLLHLKLADVGVNSLETLDLDHVLLGLSVDDDDVPVVLLDEGVVGGVDVAGSYFLGQLVVLNVDRERDDVTGRDGRLTLNFNFLVN